MPSDRVDRPAGRLGTGGPSGTGGPGDPAGPAPLPPSPGHAAHRELPVDPDVAVTELYHAHWDRLVRLGWLLLRDQAAAEDVVQDAFVATHRQWSSIRDSGRVVAYLQTAVVNGCRSVQRHAVVVDRHTAREAAAADAPGRDAVGSAETHAMHAVGRDAMADALRDLPERQREVLVLRYYADLSEAQIARTLDISAGAVKTHAHRGLSALRRTIDPREPS
ncbi:SigE family RNA polymerase sigma factor [Intrasporangium sp. YIM S08009]|uniref:SigE family RNA polymerase sigma factor n=1 Tax=Intrasporangium zincisolvens TaxID=3080018 RepID=UPI002B05BA3D|nr:SigE family RNA polymerase sigma factor [Intrasporangium sp. YIM S08009]